MLVVKGALQTSNVAGVVVTAVTGPEATQTAAVSVAVPLESVANSVNVVAAVTSTVVLPVVAGDTAPTPLSMLNVLAPVTSQASVTVPPPTGRLAGVAEKLTMVGLLLQPSTARNPTANATVRIVMVSPHAPVFTGRTAEAIVTSARPPRKTR